MKFPSVKNLAEGFLSTLKRYPFELLFALAGTIAGTVEVELKHLNRIDEGWLMRMVMTANLGLLLSLSATLFTQSRAMSKNKALVVKLIAAAFACSLIFIIDPTAREADYIRFFLLCLAFHLLVAFAAFTGKGQVNGFWQFNKTLFLRFLTSVLYGVVLFLGIAAAIGATNFLFNFKFEWDTYAILWVWIVGMFTTTFFLAGVPVETKALDEDVSYPKALKVFTQYVLIPLSTIYVAILLAYEIKILVQWSLPKGLVSDLILSYAVFGILSLLLVYPIREQDGNKWLKTYTRSFYFLMVPLLGLLFVAVGARVFKYGITEWRYFIIALACWLLFVSVYFLAFKKQNIKLIPISLCILTLLSVYGPQSAFTVSMYSQRRIIVKFFEKHNAIKKGKFVAVDSTKVTEDEIVKVRADLSHFINSYDILPLQPYFKQDLKLVSDSINKQTDKLINHDLIGSEEEHRGRKLDWVNEHFHLYRPDSYDRHGRKRSEYACQFLIGSNLRNIKGYDFSFNVGSDNDTLVNKLGDVSVKYTELPNYVSILTINDENFRFDPKSIANNLYKSLKTLKAYIDKDDGDENAQPTYRLPAHMLVVEKEGKNFDAYYQITDLTMLIHTNSKPEIMDCTFTYYVKRK